MSMGDFYAAQDRRRAMRYLIVTIIIIGSAIWFLLTH